MDKKIIKIEDTETEKCKLHQYKSHNSINDVHINKIVVFNKFPFGKQILNISLVTKIIK